MQTITLPISLYSLCLYGGQYAPSLVEDDLRQHVSVMNEIWDQAAIELEVNAVLTEPIRSWKMSIIPWESYVYGILETLRPAGAALINGFYTTWDYADLNGFSTPGGTNFVVKDRPELKAVPHSPDFSTDDLIARVSSHEVGHILGLCHFKFPESDEEDRLMFSATRGIRLTKDEIQRSREHAIRLCARLP